MSSTELNRETSTSPLTLEEANVMQNMFASMADDDIVLSVADFDRLISLFGREKLRRMMLGRRWAAKSGEQ